MGHEQEKTRLCWWCSGRGTPLLVDPTSWCWLVSSAKLGSRFRKKPKFFIVLSRPFFLSCSTLLSGVSSFCPSPSTSTLLTTNRKSASFFVCVAATADVRTIANQYQDWNGRMQDWQQGRILFVGSFFPQNSAVKKLCIFLCDEVQQMNVKMRNR